MSKKTLTAAVAVVAAGLLSPALAASNAVFVESTSSTTENLGVTAPAVYEVPLAPDFNLISLGPGPVDGTMPTIMDIAEGLLQRGTLERVIGFETPYVNPNPPDIGGKLFDPTVPGFVNTLQNVDHRLGYWFKMHQADVLVVGGDAPALKVLATLPAGATTDDGVSPVYDFIGLHGNLTIDGAPAPVGTRVEIVDGDGVLAGSFRVSHEGYYGFVPVYRDNPVTEVDEGSSTGEWLSILVDGQPSGYEVQWSAFGDAVQVDVDFAAESLPQQFALQANFPNPFNPATTIPYQLAEGADVSLQIWNTAGQLIRDLVDGNQAAGHYTATWDGLDAEGRKVAGGVYFARFTAGSFQATQKLVLAE